MKLMSSPDLCFHLSQSVLTQPAAGRLPAHLRGEHEGNVLLRQVALGPQPSQQRLLGRSPLLAGAGLQISRNIATMRQSMPQGMRGGRQASKLCCTSGACLCRAAQNGVLVTPFQPIQQSDCTTPLYPINNIKPRNTRPYLHRRLLQRRRLRLRLLQPCRQLRLPALRILQLLPLLRHSCLHLGRSGQCSDFELCVKLIEAHHPASALLRDGGIHLGRAAERV